MPIYLYKCENCSQEYEYMHKYTDTPDFFCAECALKGSIIKLTSIPAVSAIKFNGRGFHKNDYA